MDRMGERISLRSALVLVVVSVLAACTGLKAQTEFPSGQDVVPVYEGWLPNTDGTYDLVFGYFNRNWIEEFDVSAGADNHLEPGPADQGQPTHFYPRRTRFIFHVTVPKDFGQKEVVWTITTHGKTEKAYATLDPNYAMNDVVIMNSNGAGGSGGGGYNIEDNQPPKLAVEGSKQRNVKVGESVQLIADSTDDGIPKRRVIPLGPPPPKPAAQGSSAGEGTTAQLPSNYVVNKIGNRCCPDSASGLRVSWFVYRGIASNATFDPVQIEAWEDYRDAHNSPYSAGWQPPDLPADGKWPTHVTFSQPGTYILRCLANDGGLMVSQDITFNVLP
jgi:hypothetical protein